MIFETKKKRYDIEDAKNKIVLLFDYEKMCSLIANTTYSRVFMTLKEVNVFRWITIRRKSYVSFKYGSLLSKGN